MRAIWKVTSGHMLTKRAIRKHLLYKQNKKQTPWPQSASELYQPSNRRLSAKLVRTFADRGLSRSQGGISPAAIL
jgi:hypothetical protein